MSLWIFIAICVLGCDVLIYFLYEWAFGESERIRKHCAPSRLAANSSQVTPILPRRPSEITPLARRASNMRSPAAKVPLSSRRPNLHQETFAYRRLAASFAHAKPRA